MAIIPDELYRDFVERRIDELIVAIGGITPGGGGTMVPITITSNGVYHAEDYDADGFEPVTVNVPRYGIKLINVSFDLFEIVTP